MEIGVSDPGGTSRPGFLTRSFCATTRWHLEPDATAVSLSVAPAECCCNIQTILLSHIYNKQSFGNAHLSNTPGTKPFWAQAPGHSRNHA